MKTLTMGIAMLAVGALVADSENLMIPLVCLIIGGVLLIKGEGRLK